MQPPKKTKYQIPKGKPKFENKRLPSDNTSSYTQEHKKVDPKDRPKEPIINVMYQTVLDQTGLGKLLNTYNEINADYNNKYLSLLNKGLEISKLNLGPGGDFLTNSAQEVVSAIDNTKFKPKWSRLQDKFEEYKDGGTIMKRTLKYKKGGLVKHALGEIVKQGTSFDDPAVAGAGIGLASSLVDLGLDFIPQATRTSTDADGNVIGSVDSKDAALGRGAMRGAAAGAAMGPIGTLIGAGVGGAMGLVTRNKEAVELDKATNMANRNINTKRIFGKANSSTGLIAGSNTELYPHGGTITKDNPNANAELELNEQFQLPDGTVGEVDGPSHDEGGIEVALPEGTRVYSDRLKMGNKTFAQMSKPINNKIDKLDKKPESTAKKNTLALFNKQLDELFTIQEAMKTEEQVQKFANGGLVKYLPGGEIIGILGEAAKKNKQGLVAATGMVNSAIQQRNLNKVPRPNQIAPVALTAGASPDMMDFSAERSAIDAEVAATNKGIELGSGSYSTQAANKQKTRSLQLAKKGESFQKQTNMNTQANNAFKNAQAAAANQSSQINVGLDQYNLENQMNYNMWKTGNKNAIVASNTKLTTDMLNNSIMYDNQLEQARILSGKYVPEVVKDSFGKYGGKSISSPSKKDEQQAKNLDVSPVSYENISILPKKSMFKDTPYDDLYSFNKYGGTIKRSLKKTRK